MLKLIKAKNSLEFYTTERCHISEILNDEGQPELSIARCRVEVGVRTQLHSLRATQETYLIEQGEGLMDDGTHPPFSVYPGDAIVIAANHPQRIKNTGDTDLIFTVTCQPRFVSDCYCNLENE